MTLKDLAKEEAENNTFADLFISYSERRLHNEIYISEMRHRMLLDQNQKINALRAWLVGSLLANVIFIVLLVLKAVA